MLVFQRTKISVVFCMMALLVWQAGYESVVCADGPAPVIVEVSAGKFTRKNTPVSIELPKSMRGFKQFRLASDNDKNAGAAQVIPDEIPKLTWILKVPLEAGKTRRYTLSVKLLVPPDAPKTPAKKTISPGFGNCLEYL